MSSLVQLELFDFQAKPLEGDNRSIRSSAEEESPASSLPPRCVVAVANSARVSRLRRDTSDGDTPRPHGPDSLAAVLSIVLSSPDVDPAIPSAVRSVGRVLGAPLDRLPAAPRELAPLLAGASPAMANMRPQRWLHVRSLLRKALTMAGHDVMPGRDLTPLSKPWAELEEKVPGRRLRNSLSRFMRFCSRTGISPDGLEASVFESFRKALTEQSLRSHPDAAFRSAVKHWNIAVTTIDGWPQVIVERAPDQRRYAPPLASLPSEFQADFEAYFARRADGDPFSDDYSKPLRPHTLAGRRRMLLQVAGGLLESGFPPSRLTSLAVLVENAEVALRHLHDRRGGQQNHQLANQTSLVCLVAEQWVRLPAEQLKRFRAAAKSFRPKQKGMSVKVRERLRQFDSRANQDVLLGLPQKVVRVIAARNITPERAALTVLLALAVEILTVAPMRIQNLTALDLDRHFKRVGRGREVRFHIVIPAEEMKTDKPYEMALPTESAELLARFLERYRPLLCSAECSYLFPGRGGARRSPSGFGAAISKFIFRETGIVMHPHLFRHLAAKLYLERYPDAVETVRRVLNHSSSRTTMRFYAELSGVLASRRYDDLIARRRLEAGSIPVRQRDGFRS